MTRTKRLWSQVQHWMEHHPIAANSILCFHLWVAGDALAQYSEHRALKHPNSSNNSSSNSEPTQALIETNNTPSATSSSSSHALSSKLPPQQHQSSSTFDYYDPVRTLQCASYGALVTGPILATWYPYLETLCIRFNITARYGIWAAPILKVAADEFIMDPPTLVLFFSYMNLCEHNGAWHWPTLQHKLQQEFWTAWYTSLLAWPPILLGAFRFLPTFWQAPVINACCIVWDGFLSHRNAVAKANQLEQQNEHPEEKEKAVSAIHST